MFLRPQKNLAYDSHVEDGCSPSDCSQGVQWPNSVLTLGLTDPSDDGGAGRGGEGGSLTCQGMEGSRYAGRCVLSVSVFQKLR